MDDQLPGESASSEPTPSGDMTPERSTVKIEQKVSGDDTNGTGSLVLGLNQDRVVSATADGHDVEVRHYEPGGRTDLDETEVVVRDLYDGDHAVVVIEVSENG